MAELSVIAEVGTPGRRRGRHVGVALSVLARSRPQHFDCRSSEMEYPAGLAVSKSKKLVVK